MGRDSKVQDPLPSQLSFNPRARVGRDKHVAIRDAIQWKFQSTRPRGARHSDMAFEIDGHEFQSTRPRGARRQVAGHGDIALQGFNPRARVGRDNF